MGAATTFYALPYYERHYGAIKRPGLSQITNIDLGGMIHRTDEDNAQRSQLTKDVYLAMDVIKTRTMNEPASEHTLSVISDLADYNQTMRVSIVEMLSQKPDVSNKDALQIFSRYLTEK